MECGLRAATQWYLVLIPPAVSTIPVCECYFNKESSAFQRLSSRPGTNSAAGGITSTFRLPALVFPFLRLRSWKCADASSLLSKENTEFEGFEYCLIGPIATFLDAFQPVLGFIILYCRPLMLRYRMKSSIWTAVIPVMLSNVIACVYNQELFDENGTSLAEAGPA